MKRIATAVLLAAASIAASAQGEPEPPACFPLVNGYPVGTPKIIKTEVATHLFWFCGDVKRTKVELTGLSCPAGECSESAWSAAVHAVTRASAKVGTAKRLWAANVQINCDTDTRPMCVERNALIDRNWEAWNNEVKWWATTQ